MALHTIGFKYALEAFLYQTTDSFIHFRNGTMRPRLSLVMFEAVEKIGPRKRTEEISRIRLLRRSVHGYRK